jgi:hypothetical protein
MEAAILLASPVASHLSVIALMVHAIQVAKGNFVNQHAQPLGFVELVESNYDYQLSNCLNMCAISVVTFFSLIPNIPTQNSRTKYFIIVLFFFINFIT